MTRSGAILDVVSGTVEGVRGPALNHVDVQGVTAVLEPTTTLAYTLPARHRAFVYVLSGRVAVAGRDVHAGQTAWSDPVVEAAGDSNLTLATSDGNALTKVMIYSGTPISEPVAFGGPFVMNRRSEMGAVPVRVLF
ncbi:pirin-like C-terminal cupin domain-containing protein [Streptomyces sp. NBC_01217]|uniref:pirin-like C-terminal cupin domain-containing protein n=1 Tax=Streptomyces sp. NBC_01217 TaxID=2903779 RepID=UPI002E117BFD|nr:hypothetical protein OG507_00920 [Streptomyces sp. NBC_01217]